MRKILILTFLILLAGTNAWSKGKKTGGSDPAARGVIERTLGYYPKNLTLKVTGRLQDGADYFSTEVRDGHLTVCGSTPVAVCRGFYDYVRSNNYGVATWSITNIALPEQLDDQALKLVVSPFKHRYYMNVCTFGYTMPYWKWENWQRELDWMALHGFDMPLSPIGSEAIFARVWKKMGMTDEEIGDFVTGCAHLPWFRMGNMSKLDGNLSQAFYDQTIELEHKIVDRMNELGMSPIYNAFAGFVPEALKRIHPEVELVETGWRDRDCYVAHYLPSNTDLYKEIATMYIQEWEKEFGKCKYYLADSFNEMEIPFAEKGTQERFDQIADYGKHLYKSICDVNPDAVWVMQGWMFGFQRHIWDPESIRALFSAVPDDKLVLLDLSVDFNYGIWQSEYTWNYAPKIYNKQWVYSTVPNFGGRTCPIGNLDFYLNGHLRALTSPNKGNLMGYGTAPEGVENNEVTYEAISDAAWSSSYKDIDEWLKSYTLSRYGKYPENLVTFWDKMQKSSNRGFSSRAVYRIQVQPFRRLSGCYDTTPTHFEALESFIAAADEMGDNEAYRRDAALYAGLYAFGKADLLAFKIYNSYLEGNLEKAAEQEKDFRRMMLTADKFLHSVPQYDLQRWIDFARAWGVTPEEQDRNETNARRLVTTWGPGRAYDGLNDYSARIWSGLIRDYYLPRWENYFKARKENTTFDFHQWEYQFADKHGLSKVEPYADVVAAAKELVASTKHITNEPEGTIQGWSSLDLQDEKTKFAHFIHPMLYPRVKGIRFTHVRGNDPVTLKRVQINAKGASQCLVDVDQEISKENPVVEFPLEVKNKDKGFETIYLDVYLENTKKGGDSNVQVQLLLDEKK